MALCLPFRRWAIWVARRPSVLSLASTTNQSPRTLPDLANTVVFILGITNKGTPHFAGPKKGREVYSSRSANAKAVTQNFCPLKTGPRSPRLGQRQASGDTHPGAKPP